MCAADEKIYWCSTGNSQPTTEMAFLNGSERTTLVKESSAAYTGITLFNNSLYISDSSRRYRPKLTAYDNFLHKQQINSSYNLSHNSPTGCLVV